MSEYKAQILTVVLVIGVFLVLNGVYPEFFRELWTTIADTVMENVTTSIG